MLASLASNYTRVTASQTDESIASGGSIIVYGIVVSNVSGSAVTVTIEESDGSTVIQRIRCPANNTVEFSIPFRADNGVAVTTPASTQATVYHSNAGV